MPHFYRGLPRGIEVAEVVTDEQIHLLVDYFLANPELITDNPKGVYKIAGIRYSINSFNTGYIRGAYVDFLYGEGGIVRTLVQKKDPSSGDNIFIIIWELRDPDGKHRVILHELVVPDLGFGHMEAAKAYLQRLQVVRDSNKECFPLLRITTYIKEPESKVDPAFWRTANGASEDTQLIYRALEKNPKVLPNGIEKVYLNASIEVQLL